MKKLLTLRPLLIAMSMGDEGGLDYAYESVDQIPEAFRSLYSEVDGKHVLTNVRGVKPESEFMTVYGALQKERGDHKATKSRYSALGERDITEVLSTLDRIPELELAAKNGGDPEQVEALVTARIATKTAPLERQVAQLQSELESASSEVKGYQQAEQTRKVDDSVRAAAIASKVLPEAVDDLLVHARTMFAPDESGTVIATEKSGLPLGLVPEAWLASLKQSKPFYWPKSAGTGARESNAPDGGPNPWSAKGWNLTKQGALLKANRQLAEQLASQAGTGIGGPRPKE